MTREDIKYRLEEILTPRRFIHSLNVMNTAMELAQRYGVDREKAAVAGLLHDCARDIRGEDILQLCGEFGIQVDEITRAQPDLLHGAVGAELAREDYGIADEAVLDAIRYHTTGYETMSMLAKVVFIADYIEPGRNFTGVNEARKAAYDDMDSAMILSLDKTIRHLLAKGSLIHPSTINARNFIISNNKNSVQRNRF